MRKIKRKVIFHTMFINNQINIKIAYTGFLGLQKKI